jgi:hypothetical protein
MRGEAPRGAPHDAGPEAVATSSADVIDLYASAVFQWVASQKTIVDRITEKMGAASVPSTVIAEWPFSN